MAFRSLEITVISAKDVKHMTHVSKMNFYTVGSISGVPETKQKTSIDHSDGGNPDWNHIMNFTVDANVANQTNSFFLFQLKCQQILGDKDVGEVSIPVKELLDNPDDGRSPKYVTYVIKSASGKEKGELNISYRFTTPGTEASSSQPAMAYPPALPNTEYPPGGYPPQGGYPPEVKDKKKKKKKKKKSKFGKGFLGGAIGGALLEGVVAGVIEAAIGGEGGDDGGGDGGGSGSSSDSD